jgi:hypothetical protein
MSKIDFVQDVAPLAILIVMTPVSGEARQRQSPADFTGSPVTKNPPIWKFPIRA